MANKIVYGLENVHVAFMLTASTWETPTPIPGAVSFSPTPEGESTTFYADNSPYFEVNVNNGYTAELEMALVPDAVLAEMMGWEIDSNGMLVEGAEATPKEFALLGEVKGDAKNRRFVYYKCLASRSAEEHRTKEDTITPDTTTLSIKILPIEISGTKVVRGVMELNDLNASAYNAFFGSVFVPDSTIPEVNKTALAAAIALAGTLDEVDYAAASWTAMQTALTAATTVNNDVDATQQEVNAATEDLQAAILALEPAA